MKILNIQQSSLHSDYMRIESWYATVRIYFVASVRLRESIGDLSAPQRSPRADCSPSDARGWNILPRVALSIIVSYLPDFNVFPKARLYLPRDCPRALFTVAFPLARPTPLPRVVRERNIGAFLYTSQC